MLKLTLLTMPLSCLAETVFFRTRPSSDMLKLALFDKSENERGCAHDKTSEFQMLAKLKDVSLTNQRVLFISRSG
jgi:hypothetical protein